MQSLWDPQEAAKYENDDLGMRVYTSRLLGADENLVMHGGGNTSVKGTTNDFFGDPLDVLYVKGSGWDLKTIEKPGFAALRLAPTRRLAELKTLSDDDMTRQLRAFLIDQRAPAPSVEAILHAVMPFKFVDHTHTDAVVTLTNNPQGQSIIEALFPDCLILPYVMPGFILAKQVADAISQHDLNDFKGIILMHHGVFTYSQSGQQAYENMIELVNRADQYIAQHASPPYQQPTPKIDLVALAKIRSAVSQARRCGQIAVLDSSPSACGFAALENVDHLATRGPITPDHVIRAKRTACLFHLHSSTPTDPNKPTNSTTITARPQDDVARFVSDYQAYFQRHTDGELTMLDPAPRWAVWKSIGTLAFGSSIKECNIITDLNRHTAAAIQTGESLGGWKALPERDIFELEYWVLEQNKLAATGPLKTHQGKIAIVTGAASGIGLATARTLHAQGAVVIGLDIDPIVESVLDDVALIGRTCDLTDRQTMRQRIDEVVAEFGGIDILILNAGIFKTGYALGQLDPTPDTQSNIWSQTLAVNLTATEQVLSHSIQYLRHGWQPSVIIVGSRNVGAPGRAASAYSVSKAGVTQLARVAALELASSGIRVNVVHPDAVFDTGIWTDEALKTSADRYGMTVDQYKTKNLLGRSIESTDVAEMISTIAGPVFSATTGAQIPIDGGNERVI